MIEKLTKDLINKIILELNKEDNMDKIDQEIISPIFANFANVSVF